METFLDRIQFWKKIEEKFCRKSSFLSLGRLSSFLFTQLAFLGAGTFLFSLFAGAFPKDLSSYLYFSSLGSLVWAGPGFLERMSLLRLGSFRTNLVLLVLFFCVGSLCYIFEGAEYLFVCWILLSWSTALLILFEGVRADWRSIDYPYGGVGLFVGSFETFEAVHLELLQEFIAERGLSKLYLFQLEESLDPRMGDLIVKKLWRNGFQIKIETLQLKDTYEAFALLGVIDWIEMKNNGQSIHVLHGNTRVGRLVRQQTDLSAKVFPKTVRQRPRSERDRLSFYEEGALHKEKKDHQTLDTEKDSLEPFRTMNLDQGNKPLAEA